MTMSRTLKIANWQRSAARGGFVVLIAVSCLAFLAPTVFAQLTLPGGEETAVTFSPQTPQAGASFEARVDAYHYDIDKARISWTVGGEERAEFADARSITLTAPELGDAVTIQARVTEPSGAVHTASKTLAPSAIDIIVEGITRVPNFYPGASLPSAGSEVRLVARPFMYTAEGTLVDPSTLSYTWRIGTQVVQSGRNRDVFTTTMPRSGDLTVGVTVETTDGSARHVSITRITPADPVALFYEDNALYGIARQALPNVFTLRDDEISVRVEPYFVSHDIFETGEYEWSLNGARVANPNQDPQVLTLRKTGFAGFADIAFSIRNMQALLQSARGTFRIYFE